MDTHMDAHAKPDPGTRLRRRVIIELTPQELPLLTAAEERHGTKRAGIVAALHAEATLPGLNQRIADLERELAKAKTTEADQKERSADAASLNRELGQLRNALVAAEGEREETRELLADYQGRLEYSEQAAEAEYRALTKQIDQLKDTRPSALYCARCRHWAPKRDWTWTTTHHGQQRAHHRPCGDHGPGILEAASWLALRGPQPEAPKR